MAQRPPLEEKRVFLVVSANSQRQQLIQNKIQSNVKSSVVFLSHDGQDALFKVENVPPHVIIADGDLPKISGCDLALKIMGNAKYPQTAFIVLGDTPEDDKLVEAVVSGQVQFLANINDEIRVTHYLNQALNYLSSLQKTDYKLKFLARGETLFKEGEIGDSAFIVKSGMLKACRNNEFIGDIATGEFVGEMAHINAEPRVATVEAVEDCELIEIPFGRLDIVLFRKPIWAKALIRTLSRRLKHVVES